MTVYRDMEIDILISHDPNDGVFMGDPNFEQLVIDEHAYLEHEYDQIGMPDEWQGDRVIDTYKFMNP